MPKLRLLLTATALISLSACATVDLSTGSEVSSKAQAVSLERNVVQRAATKLYTAFTAKGWSTKSSKMRVQSAASILLKGLEPTSTSAYAQQNKSTSIVQADMREAANYVSQTTKAAEVYLAMAPAKVSLRDELSSLERALLMSRQAEMIFSDALNGTAQTDLVSFTQSVDALRDVTNAFGARVRESNTRFVPAAS